MDSSVTRLDCRVQLKGNVLEVQGDHSATTCALCKAPLLGKKVVACLDEDLRLRCASVGAVHLLHAYCAYGGCGCGVDVEDALRPVKRVGIDCGGVLAAMHGAHSLLSDTFIETPLVDGAFDAVRQLCERLGQDNVFIVSKAKAKVAKRTSEWLVAVGLIGPDMLLRDHVHFVDKRHDKEPLCRQLGIDAFVDDTLSVLDCFVRAPGCAEHYSALCLFGEAAAVHHNDACSYDRSITRTHNWADVLARVGNK